VTDSHKFGRFFSAAEHTVPETWEELFGSNDVVVYDTREDPYELVNLAHPRYRERNRELILSLNSMLNDLVAAETFGGAGAPWEASVKT